jgi:hypothetical protein
MYVMCAAYALHRVCEKIHVFYPNVEKLVANEKKTYEKTPVRTKLFKKPSSRHHLSHLQ